MQRFLMGVITCSFLLVGSPRAMAQIQERYTVEELLPNCLSLTRDKPRTSDTLGAMYMDGVCAGILATLLFTGSELDSRIRFCAPRAMKLEEFAKMITRYLELAVAQPTANAVKKADFRSVALGFAVGHWPCPK